MNITSPLIIFCLSYLIAVSYVFVSHKRLDGYVRNSDLSNFRLNYSWSFPIAIFITFVIVVLLSFGAKYVYILSAINYFQSLSCLFVSFIFTSFLWFKRPPNWLVNNRYKRIKILLTPPIDSFGAVLKWVSILIILFLVREGLLFLTMGRQPPSGGIEVLLPRILETAFYAPVAEETFFRWFFYLLWGEAGVGVGTIFWFIMHPFQLGLWGVVWWEIVLTSLIWWLPMCYVYVRLWKGKYFWTTYIMHTLSNLLVVFFGGMLGIPS